MLPVCIAVLGLSVFLGCGDTYEAVQKEEPVFYSSEIFANVCAEPDKAYYKDSVSPGIYSDENNWLRSWSNETYLWYDEIRDQDPACCSTPVYFDLMKTFETNAAGDPKDNFHFTQSTVKYIQSRQSVSSGYGAELVVLQARPPRDVRVAYTEPDSPAADVSLSRGAKILEIDGERVLDSNNTDTLNAGLFPGANETHTFTVLDLGSQTPRTITMTAAVITSSPVHNIDILTASNGDRIGYMLFNDHSAPAAEAITGAGRYFLENGGIDDLVIDLRYNGGGLLYIAQMLASMVAGTEKEGEIFEEIETNGKGYINSGTWNFAFEFPAGHPLSNTDLTVPSIGLKRLFVLTSSRTCSASESIINSLRGVDIDVIVIGSPTCGKPYGFIPAENCGTVYFSINFRGANAKGEADYEKGFIPACEVSEDFNHLLGDPEEILLKTALAYRDGGVCPDGGSATQSAPGAGSQAGQQLLSGEPISIQPQGLPGKIIDPGM